MATKRTIPKAMFEPLKGLTARDLHDSAVLFSLIKKEVYPAIEEAFENKKMFATLFEVNMTGYYIDIPRAYWIAALEECLKFNLVEEEFEKCKDIKELIDKIKTPARQVSKKIKNGEGASRNTDSGK